VVREISPREFLTNGREEMRRMSGGGELIIRDASGRVRMEIWVPQDDDDAA
jgi:hypothetical protein